MGASYGITGSAYEPYQMRLINETKEEIERFDKLHDFMRTKTFYELPREKKRLMYRQYRIMNEKIEVLGERMEREGITDFMDL